MAPGYNRRRSVDLDRSMMVQSGDEDTEDAPEVAVARAIAERSSFNAVTLGPQRNHKKFCYPIPKELNMALEMEKDDERMTEAAKNYSKIVGCMREFKDVRPNHYWFLMKLLIYLEHHQCIANMGQYTLRNQKIALSKYSKSSVIIRVPGLAEDRPSVNPKDLVIISAVQGEYVAEGLVTFIGEKYVIAKLPLGSFNMFIPNVEYNIDFLYPDYSLNCMHYAVDRAKKCNLVPMLFPVGSPTCKLQPQQNFLWINENIKENPEQQQAVLQILARSAFPAPYILFGPPGTGKTSTLVEAICQILKKNPSKRILVCTPSNAAADEVALRLLKNNVPGFEIHRMYSASRNWKDISDDLKPYSNFGDEGAIFISKEIFMAKKVILTTLIACHRLIAYNLRENHFAYVFVDEAGQATEPETLIPITLMTSKHDSHKGRLHGQLVIAGDPKQLGPAIASRIAEPLLGRSMLERLMEWDLYRKDENNMFNPLYVTKLVQNYRCNPAILHIPNRLFYDGELKACGGVHTVRATDWHRLPKPGFPVIFHAAEGQEEREPQSPSVCNSMEVSIVISYVRDLLRSNLGGREVLQNEIGIVTPYRLQRQKIHEQLEANNWKDVVVGTVETFQGQERDIIIMSTVRTVIYRHFGRIHIGFLSNPKRFNVALTRAKALLIVVGNPVVLQRDQYWRSFISYCYENRACVGSDFLLERYISNDRIHQLMARKHVPISSWNSAEPFQPVEEAPVTKKTFRLPEKSATRRRRMPRCTMNGKVANSKEYDSDESEKADDRDGLDILKYIKRGDDENSCLSYDDETDECEMMGYFSEGSLPASESSPGPSYEAKHPENSWDTGISTTTTDQSDKSRDSNENSYESQMVSGLSLQMAGLKMEKPRDGC